MKRIVFFALLALFCLLILSSCKKKPVIGQYSVCHCGVDDPLNDLHWLNKMVLQFESMRGEYKASVAICTYDSTSQGFLITDCEDCPDRGLDFIDCHGNRLGLVWGFAGTPLSAYNIDPSSLRTIYRNY